MQNKDNPIPERLLSLDFFRGITMFLLVAEFTHFSFYLLSFQAEGTFIHGIAEQLEHHPWHGFHFWDLIQPFFMFIVGVAMPLSYATRTIKGESHQQILHHTIRRSLLLLFMGWGLYCIPDGKITFYFQNVLAQLSVTILIAFLIMRKPVLTQILVSLGLLAFTEFLYRTCSVEGYNQPFVAGHNFGSWVDMLISGKLSDGNWVNFNAIPTAAHTIWGVLAGKLLMSDKKAKMKLRILILAGITGLIIGYGLDPVTPIIKRIATTSFIFFSGGWTFLALALTYWLIDIRKYQKGILFFTVVGMNSLAIYLFASIGGADLIDKMVTPFAWALFSWSGEVAQGMAMSLIALLILWYICYWMFKNKIFIKI